MRNADLSVAALVALSAVALFGGCADECEINATQSCLCAGGVDGAQVCEDKGNGGEWQECDCGGSGTGPLADGCEGYCQIQEECYEAGRSPTCVEACVVAWASEYTNRCEEYGLRILECSNELSCDDYYDWESGWPDDGADYPCRDIDVEAMDAGCI